MNQVYNTYCTDVNCAATLSVLGVPVRNPDPVTREIRPQKVEETKYWFCGHSTAGEKAITLVGAYTTLARRSLAMDEESVVNIVNNEKHLIHAIFDVLAKRDDLHVRALHSIRNNLVSDAQGYKTSNTKEAAWIWALSNKEPSITTIGGKAFYIFPEPQPLDYNKAYSVADSVESHLRGALDNRDTLIKLKHQATQYLVDIKGNKTILTPLNLTDEQLAKAQKYL